MPNQAQVIKRQHEEILRAARNRIKLFEVYDISDLITWFSDFHANWFVESHKGWLSWLKKLLQKDIGMFMYDEHLIGTTQIAHFNLGAENMHLSAPGPDTDKEFSTLGQSIGFDIGEYIRLLSKILGLNLSNEGSGLCRYGSNDELLGLEDKKSTQYYKSIFNGPASMEINFCLALFLATINFLNHIFSRLVVETPDTFFKIKFITVYHLVSSLNNLQNYYYPTGLLTEQSKEFLKEILIDKNLKHIKSQQGFRNILVHYKLEDYPENRLVLGAKLYGLVEYYFDGYTFEALDSLLDHQIERISKILEDWLY